MNRMRYVLEDEINEKQVYFSYICDDCGNTVSYHCEKSAIKCFLIPHYCEICNKLPVIKIDIDAARQEMEERVFHDPITKQPYKLTEKVIDKQIKEMEAFNAYSLFKARTKEYNPCILQNNH